MATYGLFRSKKFEYDYILTLQDSEQFDANTHLLHELFFKYANLDCTKTKVHFSLFQNKEGLIGSHRQLTGGKPLKTCRIGEHGTLEDQPTCFCCWRNVKQKGDLCGKSHCLSRVSLLKIKQCNQQL